MADIATLGLKVKAEGIDTANRSLDELTRKAGSAEKAATGLGRSASSLTTPFAALRVAFTGALAAASIGSIGSLADEWSDLSSRVNLAAGSIEAGAAVMERLKQVANDTYSSLRLTTEGYIENATTLRALGKSTQDALDYTAALNNAMVISGAKAERAASVQNALSKAMALGKLSGDQLNTVIANGGAVTEALAEELGVSVLQLRALGTQGKITGDVIYNALTKRAEEFAEKAGEMPATIGDAFQRIQNNVLSFVGGIDQASGASGALAEVLLSVADHVDRIIVTVGTAVTAFGTYYAASMGVAAVATGGLTGALVLLRRALIATGIGALVVAAGELVYQLLEARKASDSWGEAFAKVGQRIKLIYEGLQWSFYALVDGMKSAWANGMAFILKSTQTTFGPIAKLLGVAFGGFDEAVANLRANAKDFAANAADQIAVAGEKFTAAFAKFDTNVFSDLSNDGGVAVKSLGEVSKAANKAADDYKRIVQSAQQRIDQLNQEASLVGMAGVAADTMRMKLDLLHQAQEKGLKLTPKQKAELNGLADAYGVAAQKVAELQLAEEARFERAQLFRSPIDARIASDLRNAGLEMDSVAGQAYASYVKLTDQISTAKDGAKEFASGFINDLLNGKSAIESVANALKKLGDKLIDMALDEMINGLFKNLMGVFNMGGGGAIGALSGQLAASGGIGLFADGGVTNKPAIFGEAGPEAAVPLPDGRTIPVTINSPQGGGGTINSGNVYNFTGTSEEFQQFKKFVQERDRQFDSRAQNAVTKGNKQNRFR